MAAKVKGLLKGLRYMSLIFDEKESDMQIGYPTDVKHVAHIGWDGPSVNSPSWMSKYESTSEVSLRPSVSSGELESKRISGAGSEESLLHHVKSAGAGSPASSPHWSYEATKHPRRHRSTELSLDSATRNSSGSSRHARRSWNLNAGNDLPSPDLPAVPKRSRRRRKSKGSSGGGSTKSTSSKHQNSLPDIFFADTGSGSASVDGKKTNEYHQNAVLEEQVEERLV
ncbi:CRIB domain-containing protein RIC1 [Morella rubra]|uniref:CRIB domain-containing protein RIC1 n=1 Tax=Morella rubra TaxID=262757 RepID=A0A6A1W204_9ROSI|nr:CRIB domain-containing protein RIC1 [Morella rubra]